MSDREDVKQIITDYQQAFRDANGYGVAVRYDRGWFKVTQRGWLTTNYRRAKMLEMIEVLRRRPPAPSPKEDAHV